MNQIIIKKWIKYFIIFDYFYCFYLKHLNINYLLNYCLKNFSSFPINFNVFKSLKQTQKYIGLNNFDNLDRFFFILLAFNIKIKLLLLLLKF